MKTKTLSARLIAKDAGYTDAFPLRRKHAAVSFGSAAQAAPTVFYLSGLSSAWDEPTSARRCAARLIRPALLRGGSHLCGEFLNTEKNKAYYRDRQGRNPSTLVNATHSASRRSEISRKHGSVPLGYLRQYAGRQKSCFWSR
jgi:hypothetical protein